MASGGGGVSKDKALLVEIPATVLCTFVPTAPGGRAGRGGFGSFSLGNLGGFGGFSRMGLRDDPTRDVATGTGESIEDSRSESVR